MYCSHSNYAYYKGPAGPGGSFLSLGLQSCSNSLRVSRTKFNVDCNRYSTLLRRQDVAYRGKGAGERALYTTISPPISSRSACSAKPSGVAPSTSRETCLAQETCLAEERAWPRNVLGAETPLQPPCPVPPRFLPSELPTPRGITPRNSS